MKLDFYSLHMILARVNWQDEDEAVYMMSLIDGLADENNQ